MRGRKQQRVGLLGEPPAVVEQGKQLHHPRVRPGGLGQPQAVCIHPGPMAEAVDSARVDRQLVDDCRNQFG